MRVDGVALIEFCANSPRLRALRHILEDRLLEPLDPLSSVQDEPLPLANRDIDLVVMPSTGALELPYGHLHIRPHGHGMPLL